MNITFLHDLDTGFFSATLKPALEALGHNVTVLQTLTTYLEEGHTHHIDHLLKDMSNDQLASLTDIYKDTDYFIIRSVSDFTLRHTGIIPYLNEHNTIWKVHGSELRERNAPYSLRTWQIDLSTQNILVCGPRDPSLWDKYHSNSMQHIERPIDLSLIPRKNTTYPPFALHTPTNTQRKGTDELLASFTKEGTIQLHIISGVPRKKILQIKAQCSYFIDHLGSYPHGPYGMNSVEAMLLKIPVFSNSRDVDYAICPSLKEIIIPLDYTTLATVLHSYTPDKKHLQQAYTYAKHTHDSHTIAQQYIHLLCGL